MTPIRQFIDAVCDGKNEEAASSFNSALTDRVRTHLDIKTVELSSSIYGHDRINENGMPKVSSKLDESNDTLIISELFDSKYPFKKPSNFKLNEVMYTFNADGIDIKVQYMSEFADPVLEDNNLIRVAFGRPLKTPNGWVKVNTEELLSVKNPMKVMSTVFETMTDFITRYFKEDPNKTLSFNFHGALTSDEDNKDVDIGSSKRARIYVTMLNKLPILKKYKMKVYNLGDDGIEVTNDI